MKIINTFCTVITMKTSRSISTIQSYSELKELISKNKIARVYLFIGNGPKNQYPDMSTVKSNLKEFFKTSNLRWERRIPESGIFFIKFKTFELAIFVVLQMITTLWWNKGTLWSNYKILCKMVRTTQNIYLFFYFLTGPFLILPITQWHSYWWNKNLFKWRFSKNYTAVINVDSRGRVGTQEIEYAKTKGLNLINV